MGGGVFGDDLSLSDGGLELEDIAPPAPVVPATQPQATESAPSAAQGEAWSPDEVASTEFDWEDYKAEIGAFVGGLTILGLRVWLDHSVFQGNAGIIGVLIDSQAMTTMIMAGISAWQRYKMMQDDAEVAS